MFVETETFWSLFRSPAHWFFEIFLMVIFDGVLGVLVWPRIRKHWKHHIDRDEREQKHRECQNCLNGEFHKCPEAREIMGISTVVEKTVETVEI